MPKPEPIKIAFFVNEGEFDTEDIGDTKQLLAEAGAKLDHAYSHEICGTPLFKGTDGKWYVGAVEFTVSPANPEYLVQEIADTEHYECRACGHIDDMDTLQGIESYLFVTRGEGSPPGRCSRCKQFSDEITKARAQEIAGITKPKRQRRPGGLK